MKKSVNTSSDERRKAVALELLGSRANQAVAGLAEIVAGLSEISTKLEDGAERLARIEGLLSGALLGDEAAGE